MGPSVNNLVPAIHNGLTPLVPIMFLVFQQATIFSTGSALIILDASWKNRNIIGWISQAYAK